MGYFPNGTSNEMYIATYCYHCRNWRHDEDTDSYGCPIMDLHMFWNYDAVGKDKDETKRAALDTFIAANGDGLENDQCRMFLPFDADRCRETPDMFGGTDAT